MNIKSTWLKFIVVVFPFISVAFVYVYRNELYYLGTLFPACPSYTYLHIYCPGCGNTRSVQHLLSGDIIGSIKYNPVPLLGIIIAMLAYVELLTGIFGRRQIIIPRNKSFWVTVLIIFTAYYIIRNFIIVF